MKGNEAQDMRGVVGASGKLSLHVIRGGRAGRVAGDQPGLIGSPEVIPATLAELRRFGMARTGLPHEVNTWRRANFRHLWKGFARTVLTTKILRCPTLVGQLWLGKIQDGELLYLGLASFNIITTVGVNNIGNAFRNTFELENFKFHGIGTGSTGEVIGDTALGTELTTEYNPNSTRATGTLAGSNNIYTTVGVNTLDSGTPALREWGLFDQAATGGGNMFDRVTYAAINLVGANGDGLQTTFSATFTAGG